ncbi:Nuclear pore complex protein Nup98-Nup96 [Manis javanica]|nr:Nuclear pore complex protein Nup98-Nup96 [Manis javanica]
MVYLAHYHRRALQFWSKDMSSATRDNVLFGRQLWQVTEHKRLNILPEAFREKNIEFPGLSKKEKVFQNQKDAASLPTIPPPRDHHAEKVGFTEVIHQEVVKLNFKTTSVDPEANGKTSEHRQRKKICGLKSGQSDF